MTDNKIIAEFMNVPNFKKAKSRNLLYNKSWDWLMPVILKIGREYKLGNLLGVMRALRKHSTLRGFDGIYEAVVGFIKEHNNQDTEEEACDMLYGVDNNQ
jgi:hypothetical protein|tara:strand:+ start:140 stop:439 length:300 start_codon:yes stop_codon:yes gene_type:complete